MLLTLIVTSLGGKVKRDEAIEFQLCPGNIFIYKSYFINLNTEVKTSNQVYLLTINFHLTCAHAIKRFTSVIYKISEKAIMIVSVRPLEPSLMFMGKARS